VEKAIGHKM
jgi:hypothetical protein